MPLSPGDKLGHFEIVSLLGEGGMGVVYKARDPRLDRPVAIKLLTESRIADPDRRARFMQEARAASALNHPGIVTIHDIAEQDGRHYIVMEFVDGKPLNERIPRKGIALTEGLRLAVQIADALAAAHAAGIVHRDIKPANIMVDPQGRTKVLDFGLAKLTASTVIEDGDATRTIAMDGPRTEEGAIVGSVPYMSPEQVEGRPLDARSDIFSFGAVLYEMFTGQRAFHGETRISTLAAVVQQDPPPAGEVAPGVPTELGRVISRCLRKDVSRRSQNMSDVKLALEELRDESESGKLLRTASGPAGPVHRRWLWPVIATVCILIGAAAVGWALLRREASAPVSANMVRLSPDDGYSYRSPVISADGKFVAFISDRSGTNQVWLRQMGSGDPVQLTHSAKGVAGAEFFPDGTRLLILTESDPQGKRTIEIIPMLGGQSRVILTSSYGSAALSPDGRQVAYLSYEHPVTRPEVISVDGGAPQHMLEKYSQTQGRSSVYPGIGWMPDGRALIVTGTGHPDSTDDKDIDWFVLPVDGGDPVPMGAGAALRALGVGPASQPVATGDRIVFSAGTPDRSNVWQIRYSRESGHVAGTARQLTFGTEYESPSSVSASGTVAIQSSRSSSDFYVLPIDFATGQASGPARRLTQDGRRKIAAAGGDPGTLYFRVAKLVNGAHADDGFALDLPTMQQRQLYARQIETNAFVSPDGRQTAYSRSDGDSYSISIGDTGSLPETARKLCSRCARPTGFSPDGRYLAIYPGETGKPDFKYSVSLLEVATGKITQWLEDPTESVQIQGFLAQKWVVVIAFPPDASASSSRYYIAPWGIDPIPRSEWVEFHPPHGFRNSPTAPFIFGFQDSQLVGMRLDEKQMSFGGAVPIHIPPGSAAEILSTDRLVVRAPGIVFTRQQTSASVWLTKLPPE